MDAYIGIDPGKDGAIAVIVPNRRVYLLDFKLSTKVLYHNLCHAKEKFMIKDTCLENVHDLPETGGAQRLGFGKSIGRIETLLELVDIKPRLVVARTWQKYFGIKGDKELPKNKRSRAIKVATSAIAHQLYPDGDFYGPRGGLRDGRTDATVIAQYCFMTYT